MERFEQKHRDRSRQRARRIKRGNFTVGADDRGHADRGSDDGWAFGWHESPEGWRKGWYEVRS